MAVRYAILGAGSLGLIAGALMTENGYDVDLIDTLPAHVEAMNTRGATITGNLEKTVPVKAFLPQDTTGTYDVVVLLTKQTFTEVALAGIADRMRPDTTVVALQNGVPEDLVASLVGAERTIGGAVAYGATWEGPGVSRLTTLWESVERSSFEIGELDGSRTARIEEIAQALSSVGGCEIMPDIVSVKWTKIVLNTMFSGMSAALGCTFGEVADDPVAIRAAAHIGDEVARTAASAGVALGSLIGVDYRAAQIRDGETVEDKLGFARDISAVHRALTASMLQDLHRGVPTEIGHINGFISDKGRRFGVPTPYNDKVVELVRDAEATGRIPTMARNLPHFEALLAAT